MPADAADASSPSVPDLQRRIEELSAELRARTAERDEAQQRESAVAEILQVTNASAGDLAQVFGAMIERATRLCSATYGYIWLYDGRQAVQVASHAERAFGEWLREFGPVVPVREAPLGRALLDHRLIHVVDAHEDPAYRSLQRFRGLVDKGGVRTLLHVPLNKGNDLLGVITVYRQERRPFTDTEIRLLEAFAEQAVIAIENARLLNELRQRTNDLQESLEHQTATSDVLKAISRSTFDLHPVLQTLAETAIRLCEAEMCYVLRREDDVFRATAVAASSDRARRDATEYLKFLETHPLSPGRGSLTGRVALQQRAVQIDDVTVDPEYLLTEATTLAKIRTQLGVPLMRGGSMIGVIILSRQRVAPFSDRQIDLLRTFADQAVIAIENTRLLTELRDRTRALEESLEHQTATSDVLKIISRSSFDLQPVLDALLRTAARLCQAEFGYIFRLLDGRHRLAASLGISEEYRNLLITNPFVPDRSTLSGRVTVERGVVHIEDSRSDPELTWKEAIELGNLRTGLGVPLLRKDDLLGVIVLYRSRVESFSDNQIDLVRTFADQAVIAIENTRLITEQREALEQQTATAEVLRVINSSPGNLTPVFDAILEKAMRLCEAAFGMLWMADGDQVVQRGAPAEYAEYLATHRIVTGETWGAPGTIPARILDGEPLIHVADLADEPPYRSGDSHRRALVDIGGARTALAVPLRKDSSVFGFIMIYRQDVRLFSDKQAALLQNFAAQAVIAIENARLLTEQREALERQTATSEVLQVINSSPGDLAPVFDAMLEKATRLCEADAGAFGDYRGDHYQVTALRGFPGMGDFPRTLFKPHPETGIGRVARGEDTVHILDSAAGEAYRAGDPGRRAIVELGGARTQLCVALRKDRILLGVFTVWRREVRPFTDKQIALLQNFAAQAVIAMENARLINETREALEQQTATAEVLQVINSSPGDLAPVFQTILEKAHALCGAAYGSLQLYDGGRFRAVAVHGLPEPFANRLREGYVQGPNHPMRPLVEGADVVHLRDQSEIDDPITHSAFELGGIRTLLAVALRKDGALLGQIVAARQEVQPFADKEIALLRSFAAQAVIAMENARLLTEQREALEQQTAAAEVLQVINTSPGNLAPVFETILVKAHALCGVAFGSLQLYEGGKMRAAATHGLVEAFANRLRQGYTPGPNHPIRHLLDGNDFLHMPDLAEIDDPVAQSGARLGGLRTALFVALRKDSRLLGMIVSARDEVRPFADKEISLLRSFAAQAVIAMENARLLTEQREALEQQTATAEVLQVINSSPGNLATVFETILAKAHALCGAAHGALQLYDGEKFRAVATHGLPEALANRLRQGFTADPHLPVWRLVEGQDFVQIPDAAEIDHQIAQSVVALAGLRTVLFVALRKDGKLLGQIVASRQEVRPFNSKQIALLQNFAAQAVIAMENARLLTEQREALEQQTATAEVLQVINSSPGNLTPVFDVMLEKAMTLCGAAFGMFNTFDGRRFHSVAMRGVPEAYAQYRMSHPPDYGPETGPGRLMAGEDCVQIADLTEGDLHRWDPNRRAIVELGGARTILNVALRKEGTLMGMIAIYRQEVRPFTNKQIALLQNFAAQAVIAMENARLLTEQREALEQQTATAEVLEVINASPGNLAPVFDAMLERAVRLSQSAFGMMNLYEGNRFKGVALRGVPPGILSFEAAPHPGPHNALTRLVNGEDVVHIEDLKAYRSYIEGDPRSRNLVDVCGARSLLAVALRKDGILIGTLTAYRQEVRPFTDKQIALLEGFADQAVIAIENARLLDELRQRQAELARSVDELTATSDVLKVISRSSVDLKTVLETLVERVARLCSADQGYMFRRQDELHHLVAAYGVSPEGEEFVRTHPFVPERGTTSGRVALERRPIHIVDVLEDPDYTYREGQAVAGFRTMLGIPLLREETLVGVFVLGRTRVDPFTPKEIELITTFADQAVIAIENARLFEEIRQRQAELRVTFDNMGDGVAMFDADLRLAAWNRNFQKIIGLSDVDLAAHPTYEEYLRLLADRGEFGTENVEAALASRLRDTDKELRLERTRADGTVIEARRNAVPGGGFVLIYSDITERKRSEAAIRAARDLAETRLGELRAAQSSLIHAEKMASLGQLTAGIAHEIKNPLNFVNNFAGLSAELLDELKEAMAPVRETLDGRRRAEIDETIELLNTNLDKIASHGRRADGIVRSMLLHSRGGSSDCQSVDINAILEEALNLAYHGARAQDQSFNVTLERELQPDIPPIEIVPQDVTRVFLNLIGNGFYAVARRARLADASFRPSLRVRTRDLGGVVEIAIRDNGTGIPPEHRERLFQPFFTTKPTGEGTGLGLSISYDIVTQQHGGTIEVDSELGQFTEFTVRLPRRNSAATGRGPA